MNVFTNDKLGASTIARVEWIPSLSSCFVNNATSFPLPHKFLTIRKVKPHGAHEKIITVMVKLNRKVLMASVTTEPCENQSTVPATLAYTDYL